MKPFPLQLQTMIFLSSRFNEFPPEHLQLLSTRMRCSLYKLLSAFDLCSIEGTTATLEESTMDSLWKILYDKSKVTLMLSNISRRSCLSTSIENELSVVRWKEKYFNCLFYIALLTGNALYCHQLLYGVSCDEHDDEMYNCLVSTSGLVQLNKLRVIVPARYNTVSSVSSLIHSVIHSLQMLPTVMMITDVTLPRLNSLLANTHLPNIASNVCRVVVKCSDCRFTNLLSAIFKHNQKKISHISASLTNIRHILQYLQLNHIETLTVSKCQDDNLSCINSILSSQLHLTEVNICGIDSIHVAHTESDECDFISSVRTLFHRPTIKLVSLQKSSYVKLVQAVVESFWTSEYFNHLYLKDLKLYDPIQLNVQYQYCQKKSLSIDFCILSNEVIKSIFPPVINLNYLCLVPLLPSCILMESLVKWHPPINVDILKLDINVSHNNIYNIISLFNKVAAKEYHLKLEFYDKDLYHIVLNNIHSLSIKDCIIINHWS